MKRYRISNRTSGTVLGVFQGCDEHDAIDTMSIKAGYYGSENAAHTLGKSMQEYKDDLVCEEISEEAIP